MLEPKQEISLENKTIGANHPTYFIADIAANHDGDLKRAQDLIFQAAEAGADAAKFQHFKAETIVSDYGFRKLGSQQSHQSKWDKSVFEVYKDASVKLDWTETLQETCKQAGITFFTAPYAPDLVDALDPFIPAYKIGSGDITWHSYLKYIAQKQKPVLLATGASTEAEVAAAVSLILNINPQLVLMQCNTNYTASLENFRYIHLNVLKTYAKLFPGVILGLSDHTPGCATVLGAVTLGARVVEKHFTDDTGRKGPDHKFSMDPKTWREMVERTRELEYALGTGTKKVEENEKETVVIQRRAIRTTRPMKAGEILLAKDVIPLRPCPEDAVPPQDLEKIIGQTLQRDLEKGEHVRWRDLK